MDRYDAKEVEGRWQAVWADEKTWEVPNPGAEGFDPDKPKAYVLEMLPYPSGEPHIGHLKVYSVGDAIAHFRRRNGAHVIHPMGYDAFGLPAENNAIKTGEHPRDATEKSIAAFRKQFREWGISIDWSREVATHTPEYYRWTQWIFLQLFEKGLAYRAHAPVQWCPKDATVLANEQVIDGRCERCGTQVVVRNLQQWFFRITDYADRLLEDFDLLESWPEHVITMQRNWIGRSEGAEVVFRCEDLDLDFPVFTTRPDTLFGSTFFVLAPEHPQLSALVEGTDAEEAVREYVNATAREAAEERGSEDRPKTGVALGRTVTNPVNGEEIPMFVADYVLMDYGTGAVMAVPAHDQRDHDFATTFDLPIRSVVEPADGSEVPEGEVYTEHGETERLVNSGEFDGTPASEAIEVVTKWLEGEGRGKASINYRLRDWLVSRQRYWGAPIPIINCEKCGMVPVPDDQLPVKLPDIEDYAPKGKSPLAGAEEWVNTECPKCGGPGLRETDTMDTFVDSSWYFIRYLDPQNTEAAWSREAADNWMPVDQYIGGVEHAILHLMYARFFVKALADMGHIGVQEPFANLFTQGMITRDGAKMSKSRGNVVPPADYVDRYGADTLRTYICFIGPPDRDADWRDEGVDGVQRFLSRLWRLGVEIDERTEAVADPPTPEGGDARVLLAKANWAIGKVTRDFERGFQFNTAISAVMELINEAYRVKDGLFGTPEGDDALRFTASTAASLIWPFAPHLGAEVYDQLNGERVWETPWPKADDSLLASDTVTYVVQVNGKLRARLETAADAGEDDVLAAARADDGVQRHLEDKQVVKEVFVPGRLVNIVVR